MHCFRNIFNQGALAVGFAAVVLAVARIVVCVIFSTGIDDDSPHQLARNLMISLIVINAVQIPVHCILIFGVISKRASWMTAWKNVYAVLLLLEFLCCVGIIVIYFNPPSPAISLALVAYVAVNTFVATVFLLVVLSHRLQLYLDEIAREEQGFADDMTSSTKYKIMGHVDKCVS